MRIAINAGNTNVSFGVFEAEKLLRVFSIKTSAFKENKFTKEELAHFARLNNADRVCVASVVPQICGKLAEFSEKHFHAKANFLTADHCKLKVEYDRDRIGIDRLVNAYAALKILKAPAIVVDAGTCITFDAVTSEAKFIGGPICAGVRTSIDAICERSALIKNIEFEIPDSCIVKDTIQGVRSGAFFGLGGLVDRIVSEMSSVMPEKTAVIATGGDANLLLLSSRSVKKIIPNLTLVGINLLE